MAGSLNLFDRTWLTSSSESSSRNGERIDTLQIHHAATTGLNGARSLMDAGGRTVSSNGLLATDGTLYEVVALDRRAFTSATGFDRRSLTVETINSSGAPGWGISDASRERLARLAVAMYRAGILGGFHRGPGGIIGHNEVPGTYATACPGPDMHLDWIAERARSLNAGLAGLDVTEITETESDADMPINFRSTTGGVSYTMVPGIQVTRHDNEIAAALTTYFNNGKKWGREGLKQEEREALGERQLRDDEILVELGKYGFGWASRDIARLPERGKVLYADYILELKGYDISK